MFSTSYENLPSKAVSYFFLNCFRICPSCRDFAFFKSRHISASSSPQIAIASWIINGPCSLIALIDIQSAVSMNMQAPKYVCQHIRKPKLTYTLRKKSNFFPLIHNRHTIFIVQYKVRDFRLENHTNDKFQARNNL